ncbi:MAG TPA: AAC(3) family N-acetyltransferase [Candidatus Ratteibacteria bacterium]|nr:AAC(3) family N-acetyltransferase [Candidatus Ratteibacteria bacterium]
MFDNIVKKNELIKGFEELGLKKGDIVIVHSSLSSFGYVEGGATTVIDSLKEIITENGILAMPSFPAFIGGEYGIAEKEIIFDVRISPTAMGKIPDTFWRKEKVKRSLHPTHSVAAWGKEKEWLISGHENCICSCGENTPLHKICKENGKILLIGIGHNSNTTLHTIEDINGAPTRSCLIFYPKVIDYEGQILTVPLHPHFPGLLRKYEKADEICKENKIQNEIKIGHSLCKLIEAGKLFNILSKFVKEDPLFLIDKNYYAELK